MKIASLSLRLRSNKQNTKSHLKAFFNSNKFSKPGLGGFNKQVIPSRIRKIDFSGSDENTPDSSVSVPTISIRNSYSDKSVYDKNAIKEVSKRLQDEICKFLV